MKKHKYSISVDWLQTYCHAKPLFAGKYSARGYNFTVVEEGVTTQTFDKLYTVYLKGLPCARVQQVPRIKGMHKDVTIVKLENRILYCEKYIDILYAIFESMKMYYKGITRIDLCYDCNEFRDGRNPAKFIRQYVTSEPNTALHMYRANSSVFHLVGNKKNSSSASFQSIRWGSSASNVGVYLYNKTLELIEVKDKPWIREQWEKNGLFSEIKEEDLKKLSPKLRKKMVENHGLNEYVVKPVWRMEISIKAKGRDIVNMSTGELFQLSPRYLESQPKIERLFYVYAKKFCDFRVAGKARRLRDYTKLDLFGIPSDITAKPVQVNACADTGRMEKICYNKLEKLAETYSNFDTSTLVAVAKTMDFLKSLAGVKHYKVEHFKYANALSNFKGQKWLEDEAGEYLQAVAAAHEAKQEVCAEFLYDACYYEDMPPIPPLPGTCDFDDYLRLSPSW